ncbi:unnamed protein product [Rodentolepis nana]|uniref:ANAPC4_WD40 domain-containing protein n=1 Tax=Rodentolepis nana TaxID=102285 RepID=A0A0R3TJ03_RODNA|nr:unnamed protein product [Rodentolepis nana]
MSLGDYEHLVSVSVGARSIWLLSNTGRVWFNTISALVNEKVDGTSVGCSLNPESMKQKAFWSPMAGRLVGLAVSPFDQVRI